MQIQHSQQGQVPIPQHGFLLFSFIFLPPKSLYYVVTFFCIVLLIFKGGSLQMETKETIQIDIDCCKMKSVTGYCPRPVESASAFLSKKWTISIIITVGNFSKLRFNDLLERLDGATAKTLSNRLKELRKEGIVQRRYYNEIPPRVEYSLTQKGKQLMKSLHPLIHWAEHN